MVIGILSDNHGRMRPIEQALSVFAAWNVKAILHCGDLGGLETVERLAGAAERFFFVWGNTDEPQSAWAETVERLGLRWPNGPLLVELDGRRIVLAHGHEWQLAAMRQDPSLDYIFYGHTHSRSDQRNGRTRYINPGALYRTVVPTVATLDLATDALAFHELPRRN
ncbi:MAG: YfcE family phosphodiesterase [Phycisphaerae bacterium]|nr:YfcE family phosphodiesterase [Phycisphaerae bacterium]